MSSRYQFEVIQEHSGLRLDQSIAAHLPEVSRTRAKKALAEGGVFVDKKRVKVAGRILRAGQKVEVNLAAAALTAKDPEEDAIEIPIVKLTEDYIVVDKPSGVFSAPTPESDRRDLLAYLRAQLDVSATDLHLVHRLDRPTSGLMVVARNPAAAAHLSEQVKSHHMRRKYQAFLAGRVAERQLVTEPILGKEAHTEFVPLEQCGDFCWVEAELKTGRTHQVRIHAECLNAPIAGDSKYGRKLQRAVSVRPPRLALHACELTFTDPSTGELQRFVSPMAPDLMKWLRALPPNGPGC